MLVARRIESSRANGPGNRAVVWFQGCDARCPGCCNPELQPMTSDAAVDVSSRDLADWFIGVLEGHPDVRGLTLSGGEPLHSTRMNEVLTLINRCRNGATRPFDVLVFTGHRYSQVPHGLPGIDMLISGPYDVNLNNEHGIVASTNQRILRLTGAFLDISDAELISGSRIVEVRMVDGTVTVTGMSSVDETLDMLGLEQLQEVQ